VSRPFTEGPALCTTLKLEAEPRRRTLVCPDSDSYAAPHIWTQTLPAEPHATTAARAVPKEGTLRVVPVAGMCDSRRLGIHRSHSCSGSIGTSPSMLARCSSSSPPETTTGCTGACRIRKKGRKALLEVDHWQRTVSTNLSPLEDALALVARASSDATSGAIGIRAVEDATTLRLQIDLREVPTRMHRALHT